MTPKRPTLPLNDCPQHPVLVAEFSHIHGALDEVKGSQARITEALERLAEQSIMVKDIKEYVVRLDADLSEAFKRIRVLENKSSREDGANEVKDRRRVYWDKVKIEMTPWVARLIILFLYLEFRLDIGSKLGKMVLKLIIGG